MVAVSDQAVSAETVDVAIIGAGVAGAMAGILCARAGLKTLLLERQRFPRHKVCGCCVNGRALQILRKHGMDSGLASLNSTTTSGLEVRCRGRRLDIEMPISAAVSRSVFDQWLVTEAVDAGCRFLDEVSATVEPHTADGWHSADSDRGCRSRKTSRNEGFREHSSADRAGFRTIQLIPRGLLPDSLLSKKSAVEHLSDCETPSSFRTSSSQLSARIVLICDGLGHPSLSQLSSFQAPAQPGARIGLGAVFPCDEADAWIDSRRILMAVSPHGYAGIVHIENQQLNLAAAVDPVYLNETRSPLKALEQIFQSAGVPVPKNLSGSAIRGTLPLTRQATRISGHRMLLLGDATGYIEPFTGEGMAWALSAASAVAAAAADVVADGWNHEVTKRWQATFHSIVGREQLICRTLAMTLRHPWLLSPLMKACHLLPSLTRRLVSQINRVPETLEIHR